MLSSQIADTELQDPYFDTFKGTAYKMPIMSKTRGKLVSKRIQEHYAENVYDYPEIGSISLDEIQIAETGTAYGEFPGIDRKVGFAMILHSKMYIQNTACYEFSLDTDDGSILWIDDIEVLNNDGGHHMRLKMDSLILDRGEYSVKLWYFQGMPDRFGFLFDTKAIGDTSVCSKNLSKKQIDIDGSVLFDSGTFILKSSAYSQLQTIADSILEYSPPIVYVIGHTDDLGSNNSNETLSLKRAESVTEFLSKKISSDIVKFKSEGKGESEPVQSNENIEGRAANRRVEIRFSCMVK